MRILGAGVGNIRRENLSVSYCEIAEEIEEYLEPLENEEPVKQVNRIKIFTVETEQLIYLTLIIISFLGSCALVLVAFGDLIYRSFLYFKNGFWLERSTIDFLHLFGITGEINTQWGLGVHKIWGSLGSLPAFVSLLLLSFLLLALCKMIIEHAENRVFALNRKNRIKAESEAEKNKTKAKIKEYIKILEHRDVLLKKAEEGDTDAQYELGLLYAHGAERDQNNVYHIYIEPDYDEAVRWWRDAGNNSDSRSQVNLAYIYATGIWVVKDEDEAFNWWHRAAEVGHAGAQYELGQIHSDKAWEINVRSEKIAGDLVGGQEAKQEMSKAVLWMQRAGEQGYVEAQRWLGSIFGYCLEEKPQNAKESIKWCRLAANEGDPWAQFSLANLYADGIGISQNWAEATRWYLTTAEQGYVDAQRTLGHMYASGEILPKNYFEAAKWWQLVAIRERRERYVTVIGMENISDPDYSAETMAWLCEVASEGSPLAQNLVKSSCANIEKEHRKYLKQVNLDKWNHDASPRRWLVEGEYAWFLSEDQKIMTSLRDLAEKKDAEAQLALGFILGCYSEDEKLTEAVKWFRLAAAQGTLLAQRILGDLYLHGHYGIEIDEVEAIKWYQMAAEQGDIEAFYQLGHIIHFRLELNEHKIKYEYDYSSGSQIWPKEYSEAARWYMMAAEKGHAVAQHYLAELYVKGRGVPEDYTEAVKWQRKAAEQGYAKAQKALAEMYEAGIDSFPQDSPEAVKWFKRASVQGSIATESENTGAGTLAFSYYYGRGVAQDGAEAMKWYRREERDWGS